MVCVCVCGVCVGCVWCVCVCQEQKQVEDPSREVKKVRKARNRRQEWNMMAYDKEFRPDTRLTPSPYHGMSSEGSLSPDRYTHTHSRHFIRHTKTHTIYIHYIHTIHIDHTPHNPHTHTHTKEYVNLLSAAADL